MKKYPRDSNGERLVCQYKRKKKKIPVIFILDNGGLMAMLSRMIN